MPKNMPVGDNEIFVERHIRDAQGFVIKTIREPLSDVPFNAVSEDMRGAIRAEAMAKAANKESK